MGGFLLAPIRTVIAQTPEPTPSPTPADQLSVQLTSGSTLVIERHITYGEISITLALLGLGALLVLFGLYRGVSLWLR